MKRTVRDWSLEDLHKKRDKIHFPEYQRQPNLWSDDKKRLLIDSILEDIDIPKLYFNRAKGGVYEVVDGQQRLWAIWDFLDDAYPYYKHGQGDEKVFSKLSDSQQKLIKSYVLQITEFEDADDEYLRKLFIRLQLGLLLIAGEKLNALTGKMKDFVFLDAADRPFVRSLGIPSRRYSKEALCAQICINSFTRAKLNDFARTRYEDLEAFFIEYQHPIGKDKQLFEKQTAVISDTLEKLEKAFGSRAKDLKNRSYILSLYLLLEEGLAQGGIRSTDLATFAEFALALWGRLRSEIGAGFDRNNRELYTFETLISSAPGEKYQIKRRHEKLREYYAHFLKTKKIKGDG